MRAPYNMNYYLLVLVVLGCVVALSEGMLYRRDDDNRLKPDLLPVSSTVVPLPYYSVYGYEKQLIRQQQKKRPQGKISLVTKLPS